MTAELSLSSQFEEVASRVPAQIAVAGSRGTRTYSELLHGGSALAGTLAPRLSGAPAPVVLLLDHGADMVVGILGVLMAGGIVAPLDPSDPPARLRANLEHAEPVAIVTNAARAAFVRTLTGPQRPVVVMEEVLARGVGTPDLRPPTTGGDTPAWLYHTSGTTGRPKAVLHSHRSLLHAVGNTQRHLALREADRFTWFALASTSQGGSNVLAALLTGGTLYPYAPRTDGIAAIPDWLRRERITFYNSSATLFRAFTSLLSRSDTFPDMRVVRVGSERVRPSDVEAWRRHFPPTCAFVNRYSCTEAGSIALTVLDRGTLLDRDVVPVGRPLPGKHVRIVDNAQREVPDGAVGEIAVQSAYLALGYWRDPDATSAAFQPVADAAGERLFRTGDLGCLRPDGQVEHLGRVDGRAKIRGHRVELEEIEQTLARHPSIRLAAVSVERGRDGEDRLVATLVSATEPPPSPRELRTFLSASLPPSSLPAVFATTLALPLTPSGKLDRAALVVDRLILIDDVPQATAENSTELAVTAVWVDVLGVPVRSVHDDFLSLGGDSLQGTRILARVLDRWGVEVSFEELLDASTVRGLARAIDQKLKTLN